jgi:2-C-methyl-D-erythritol 4-phosphate cytidylyltransferase
MPQYIALVPAAGTGARMGAGTPKQYLELAGRPLLYYAVQQLASNTRIDRVLVVLSPGDHRFAAIDWGPVRDRIETLYCGGAERSASVYNGLLAARDGIEGDDWVLVHDAARPCLSAAALHRLIEEIGEDETGGLLALPVADTLKRANGADRIAGTVSRESLWHAQTPQMFRYGLLVEALRRTAKDGVTDEAGAIERIGLRPRLVRGEPRNLKITYPEDLELAQLLLREASGRPGSAR